MELERGRGLLTRSGLVISLLILGTIMMLVLILSQKLYNLYYLGFQFMTGDTLTVRVNFDKSTVTFEKGDKSYEMPIQLKIGDIYGFVGCTYNGDIWLIP